MSPIPLIVVASYLLGSIPFGYLLVRIFRGEDVRQLGSGNIGATNVSRRSPTLGVITLLLDAAKGSGAVLLSYLIADRIVAGAPTYEQMAVAALCAIVGHMFPVWLKFRGGKGVATALGSFVLIAPLAVVASIVIFLIVVVLSRYVSLGSVVAVAIFPFLVWFIHQLGVRPPAMIAVALASLLVIARHHQNLRRLLAGTENRIGAKAA